MPHVHIGSQAEYVNIRLPESFSSEGWGQAQVEVATEGFRGSIKPWLERDELVRFLHALEALYEQLHGRAELTPVEKQFFLSLAGDGKGHMAVSGEAASSTYQNKLQFSFHIDQTFLPQVVAQLKALLGQTHAPGA